MRSLGDDRFAPKNNIIIINYPNNGNYFLFSSCISVGMRAFIRFIVLFSPFINCICSLATPKTTSNFYTWKDNLRIHYTCTTTPNGIDECKDSVILQPGFGVGTFHFNRNVFPLAAENFNVYCIEDLLGQGKSWPESHKRSSSSLLRYSLDTWAEKILCLFYRQNITE